jgi:phage virion morphogenesis protein
MTTWRASSDAPAVQFKSTISDVRIQLNNFSQRIGKGSLLRVFGEVMRASIEQTFREQGSPAGSWAPLAASTLLRDRMRGAGRKILIRSGRLKNSITYAIVGGERLLIGTNLRYAGIQQLGGEAGRKRRSRSQAVIARDIPARPYLVFRPEDEMRMQKAGDAFIAAQARGTGLKTI